MVNGRISLGVTTALKLLVAELVALTVGGTVEALRERTPLLWNAKPFIGQASAVHEILLKFWPELSRWCGELRSAIAAYQDASTNASARLMAAAGTSRALNLLPPETWKRFAQRATVDELAAVLADQVFDARLMARRRRPGRGRCRDVAAGQRPFHATAFPGSRRR